MDETLVRLRSLLSEPSPAALPTVVLHQGAPALGRPMAMGTRVICLQDAGMSLATLTQTASAVGLLIQGIRKIGDHVFVEHVAL
jgi:hypothetical protein